MDYLWTPWRYAYVTTSDRATECIFCGKQQAADRDAFIIHRGQSCYIVLNIFPYTSGHVMIVPYAHIDQLQKLPPEGAMEMMALLQKLERTLRDTYHPDGINLGMNLGKAAGAGVAQHIHMHVLPRWVADASFITTIGETRVLPESLEQTWERLRVAFQR
jgi:ATP adenylyltransferase